MKRTFAEKIFNAPAGAIVFAAPDIVLTHDNTSSIYNTFVKMGGKHVFDPSRLLIVLDHNAPPCDAKLATQYQMIRDIVRSEGIKRFYDSGNGICHQLMSHHARPGMLIAGADSHTSTAGAFNAMAVGIDRTEAAGIWKKGETWFRVPESIMINLKGELNDGVSAKDLALWIVGMLGSEGANYMSVEYHGEGLKSLSISDRMTLANLASEMGAKNAVFPADVILRSFMKEKGKPVWADDGAAYFKTVNINLNDIYPVVSAPHNVDNIKSVDEVEGTPVHEGLIGTCTNGRIEDLRIAAGILKGRHVKEGFQLHIVPASKEIFLQAINEGIVSALIEAGANILSPSCGPCLGTGQGIPANGHTVISTANRNFPGRMGNKEAGIYLASPATVSYTSLSGVITSPVKNTQTKQFPFKASEGRKSEIINGEDRKIGAIWNYSDIDNLNTDQMFAGKHTYSVQSSDPAAIMPFLFEDFDPSFKTNVRKGDIIIAGENFGCGSSREHPSVGLAFAGIKCIIVKSVNRIFYRSSINQGLTLIVHRGAVEAYKPGDNIEIEKDKGILRIGGKIFSFEPLPEKLQRIIEMKGLVNYMKAE
ncbi:MAG: aconitase/3-isopropylmalate dehydratase large subunit family protein [Chloroflexota bacterium]